MGLFDNIKIRDRRDTPMRRRVMETEGMGGSYEERLYALLTGSAEFRTDSYKRGSLQEGMELVEQVIGGYWKPRFILNHELKRAYEWMDDDMKLVMVSDDDIDRESIAKLPEEAEIILGSYSFRYPSFIYDYKDGIARVKWQLRPDGMYWMDEDGYGMSFDDEISVYGFIDKEGRVVEKFRL